MDFFERQDLARASSRKIVLLFLLALPCVIAAVYVVSVGVYAVVWGFFAFWRSVLAEIDPSQHGSVGFFLSLWQPQLFLWVGAATLLVIACGSLYKTRQLAPGGRVVARLLGGERLEPATKKLDELRLALAKRLEQSPAIYELLPEPKRGCAPRGRRATWSCVSRRVVSGL